MEQMIKKWSSLGKKKKKKTRHIVRHYRLLSCLKPFLWEGQQDFQKSHIIEGTVVQSTVYCVLWFKSSLKQLSWGEKGRKENRKLYYYTYWGVRQWQKITLSSHALFDTFCFLKLQEFMIHSISSLELEMLVLMCDKTVYNCYPNKCIFCCNRLSCLLLQTFAARKNLQAFRSHTSVPLVLNSLKLPQFVLRLPLTLRNDCEKDLASA